MIYNAFHNNFNNKTNYLCKMIALSRFNLFQNRKISVNDDSNSFDI